MQQSDAVPVNVITGFLGSGKTTLLNHLVRQPSMAEALVVINEFGDIGLDHRLVAEGDETSVVEMSSGCLCCTIRGDLSRTLQQASEWEGGRSFSRVIIETTGLADPAPILHTLMTDHWLAHRFTLDSVVCLVDAVSGFSTLQAHREAQRQAAIADRLLISKTDLVEAMRLSRLADHLAEINPAAEQLQVSHGEVAADLVTGAGLRQPASPRHRAEGWLSAASYTQVMPAPEKGGSAAGPSSSLLAPSSEPGLSRHGERIESFCFTVASPIPPEVLEDWLDLLMGLMGERMLRVKAIVHLTDRDEPVALHGVQHIFHPPEPLPRSASPDGVSRFVFITNGVAAEGVAELFAYFQSPQEP